MIDNLETDNPGDLRPESVQLPSPAPVKLKVKSQQKKAKVHLLPGQIQDNLSGPSTRNALSIYNRNAMKPNNGHSNESDDTAEAKEQKKILEKCLNMIRIFGIFVGIRMTYFWKPQRSFPFLVTWLVIGFAIFSVVYTVHLHYVNESYLRVLEPLAISGIAVSVTQNVKYKRKIKCNFIFIGFSEGVYSRMSFSANAFFNLRHPQVFTT